MYLYLIFILLLVGSFLEVFDSKRKKAARIIYYYTLSILFLLSFLRWERGTDWSGYYDYFSNIYDLDFSNNFENGFILLNYCIHSLFNNYTILLFVLAAIQYFYLSKAIGYLSIYPVMSLLCYLSVTKGGIFFVRQYIALAILMYSIKYVIEKKIYKFIFAVIIACMIHRTALLFLPVYFFFYRNIKIRYYIIVLLIIIPVAVYLSRVFDSISTGIVNSIIENKINNYINKSASGETYGIELSKSTILIRGVVKRGFIILLYFLFMRKELATNGTARGLFNIYFFGTCLYILLTPLSEQLSRVCLYFDITDIFLFPLLIYKQNIKWNKLLFFTLVIVFSSIRLHSSIELRKELFIPYKSIFNKEKIVEIG